MRVLVSAASRHGATWEIAEAIGADLARRGHAVRCERAERVDDLRPYGAVVLGSAVYAGHWLAPARDVARHLAAEPGARSVFLFSSGPIGPDAAPRAEAMDVAPLVQETGSLLHRTLAGRLVRSRLSFAERAVVVALRAPDGDFRDWDEIARYAEEVADLLAASPDARAHRALCA